MKRILLWSLFAITPLLAFAEDVKATIKQQAQSCAKALLASDYDGVVKYTHPRVVSLVGGKEAMVAVLKRGTAQMRADGISFEDASVGTPEEPKKIATWLTSVVPQHIVMKVPGGHLHQDAFLLGISEDDGKNWVFLDLGPITKAQFAQVFPELESQVPLPEKKKPVFKKDE